MILRCVAYILSRCVLEAVGHADIQLNRERTCSELSEAKWEHPGGVSSGATYCIKKFLELEHAGKNAYELIDAPIQSHARIVPIDGLSVPWTVTFNATRNPLPLWYSKGQFPYTGELETAEWMVPIGYRQQEGEPRFVFVHGSDSRENSRGRDYAGLSLRIANWTQMPVLSFNYPTEPIAPWPQNIRSVMYYLAYALKHGPEGLGKAGTIFFLGDSEGTLVVMQTVLAILDPTLRTTLGYGQELRDANKWLGGVVLSSPVIDVACQTPSFEWNCLNETNNSGDPDTGNCTLTPTLEERRADCLWSYLSYHFGFTGLRAGSRNATETLAAWEVKRDFFEQSFINPLRANFAGFPPLLLLAGDRDFYYSDSPSLANLACLANVDVEVLNVVGVYHDFIQYSDGCGGPTPMEEGVEAYRRITAFVSARTKHPTIVI